MESKLHTYTYKALYENADLKCNIEILTLKYTNKIAFFITEINKLGSVIRCDLDTENSKEIQTENENEQEQLMNTKVLLGNRADENLSICSTAITKILNEYNKNMGKSLDMGTVFFISLKKRENQGKVIQFLLDKIKSDITKIAY